jgi:hypothetical protein
VASKIRIRQYWCSSTTAPYGPAHELIISFKKKKNYFSLVMTLSPAKFMCRKLLCPCCSFQLSGPTFGLLAQFFGPKEHLLLAWLSLEVKTGCSRDLILVLFGVSMGPESRCGALPSQWGEVRSACWVSEKLCSGAPYCFQSHHFTDCSPATET